jgi:hypothetical protein
MKILMPAWSLCSLVQAIGFLNNARSGKQRISGRNAAVAIGINGAWLTVAP